MPRRRWRTSLPRKPLCGWLDLFRPRSSFFIWRSSSSLYEILRYTQNSYSHSATPSSAWTSLSLSAYSGLRFVSSCFVSLTRTTRLHNALRSLHSLRTIQPALPRVHGKFFKDLFSSLSCPLPALSLLQTLSLPNGSNGSLVILLSFLRRHIPNKLEISNHLTSKY